MESANLIKTAIYTVFFFRICYPTCGDIEMHVNGDSVIISDINDPVGIEIECSRYMRECYKFAERACGFDMGIVSSIELDDIGIPIYGIPVVPREPDDPRLVMQWQENMRDAILALEHVPFPRLEDGKTVDVVSVAGKRNRVRSNIGYSCFHQGGEIYWYLTTTTLRKERGIVPPPFSPLSSRRISAPASMTDGNGFLSTFSLSIYAAEMPDFRGREESVMTFDAIAEFIGEARGMGIAPISDPSAVIADARLVAREGKLGTMTTGGFSKETAAAFADAVPALERLARLSFKK